MSRTLAVLAAGAAAVVAACRQDPGIDIVRVPAQAYLPADAAPAVAVEKDAAPDASPAFMVCVDAPPPNDGKPSDDEPEEESSGPEMSSDFPNCPTMRDDRNLDPRVTQRHREQGEEEACCYRLKGSTPHPVKSARGE